MEVVNVLMNIIWIVIGTTMLNGIPEEDDETY